MEAWIKDATNCSPTEDHAIMRTPPSQEYVRKLFDYNPGTGKLTWKIKISDKVTIGAEAGSLATHRLLLEEWIFTSDIFQLLKKQ